MTTELIEGGTFCWVGWRGVPVESLLLDESVVGLSRRGGDVGRGRRGVGKGSG